MKKPESKFWSYMRAKMRTTGWHVQRHEDAIALGIPDLSYGLMNDSEDKTTGWIELKVITWPKKPSTTIKINHFTPEQKVWLKLRGKTGGSCFLFIKAPDGYMLFHWTQLDLIGTLNQQQMKDQCLLYMKIFDALELADHLSKD